VQFGLQFEPSDADAAVDAPGAKLPAVPAPSALPVAAPSPAAENTDEPAKPSEGAEVVRLDRFRKK
jgi:uncharacterized protein